MSKSILHQLYYGDLSPSQTITPPDPQYEETQTKASKLLFQLHKELSDKQFQLLERYLEYRSDYSDMELSETFAEAFRMGAQVAFEIQNRDVSNFGSISVSVCGRNEDDQDQHME